MRSKAILLIVAGLLLVYMGVAACSTAQSTSTEISSEMAQTILQIAGHDTRVQSFIKSEPDYTHEVIPLTPEAISELAHRQPVIYGGLPNKPLYRIEYKSDNKGVLAVVDLEERTVVRYFRTVGVGVE